MVNSIELSIWLRIIHKNILSYNLMTLVKKQVCLTII
jgi:hypothetical protein